MNRFVIKKHSISIPPSPPRICLSIETDSDGSECVVARNFAEKIDGKFMGWFNVVNECSIRTPSFMIPFAGREVVIYQNRFDRKMHELFRIKPIGFFFETRPGLRIVNPHFTKTGSLVIPKGFIILNEIDPIINKYVSFDECAGDKYLLAYFIDRKTNRFHYKLHNYNLSYRTKRVDIPYGNFKFYTFYKQYMIFREERG